MVRMSKIGIVFAALFFATYSSGKSATMPQGFHEISQAEAASVVGGDECCFYAGQGIACCTPDVNVFNNISGFMGSGMGDTEYITECHPNNPGCTIDLVSGCDTGF